MKKISLIFILTFCLSFFCYPQQYKRLVVSPDIELIKISNEVYIHVSVSQLGSYGKVASNGMIFVKGTKAFLFDTPATNMQTKELVSWIKKNLNSKVVGFVPNHSHTDCMGGLGYLHQIGVKSYANSRTIAIAQKEHLPVPKVAFKDSLALSLGGDSIKCYFFGEAHSKDNIVVWLPKQKVLFGGCMLKEMTNFKMGNTADANQDEWASTIEKLTTKFKDAKVVIPGHGKAGGYELLEHTLDVTSKELKFTNKLRRIFQNYPL